MPRTTRKTAFNSIETITRADVADQSTKSNVAPSQDVFLAFRENLAARRKTPLQTDGLKRRGIQTA